MQILFQYESMYYTSLFILLIVLAFMGISPLSTKSEDFSDVIGVYIRVMVLSIVTFMIIVFTAILFAIAYKNNIVFSSLLMRSFKNVEGMIYIYGGLTVLIMIFKFFYFRHVLVKLNQLKRKLWKSQSTDELTDIEDDKDKFKVKNFNPQDYYNFKIGLFIGLDVTGKPIYIPWEQYKSSHMEIIGPTQSGKGVLTGCIIDQCIRYGITVIFIAPKFEKGGFTPRIMSQASKAVKKSLQIVDLVNGRNGRYAPFRGGKLKDIKNRAREVFKVRRVGSDADFHKGKEMRLLDQALEDNSAGADRGVQKIFQFLKLHRTDPKKEVATGIEDSLYQMVGIDQVITKIGSKQKDKELAKILYPSTKENRAPGGVSIARNMMEGNSIYLRSKTNDTDVLDISKLFLIETIQEAERLADFRDTHITLVVDELKFMACDPVTDALAAIADKNVNMILQYQSKDDPKFAKDRDLDKEATANSTHQNTQIKMVYGTTDFETATWVSEMSGTINKTVPMIERTEIDKYGAEKWQKQRMYKTESEALITTNNVTIMPGRVGVLIRKGELAEVTYTAWVDISDSPEYGLLVNPKKMEKENVAANQT